MNDEGLIEGLNKTLINLEYYKKFPITLRDALINGKVMFPDSLQREYETLHVFRGVKYNDKKTMIDKSDFLSHIERKKNNPMIVADDKKISSYSCSCFLNMDEMHQQTKFPSKHKAIAKGIVKCEYGPIVINELTSHVDWYLYDNVDPSKEFQVVEKWEENG